VSLCTVHGKVDGKFDIDTLQTLISSPFLQKRGLQLSPEIFLSAVQPDLESCCLVADELQDASSVGLWSSLGSVRLHY
jgi:hypothetical protein